MLSWLFTLGLEACTAVMDCFIFVVAGRAQSSCRHSNKLSLITNAAWHIMYIDVDRLAGQQLTQDSAPWHNYAQMTSIGQMTLVGGLTGTSLYVSRLSEPFSTTSPELWRTPSRAHEVMG